MTDTTTTGAKCGARETTGAGVFTCDRAAGHYPDTDHAAHGIHGRIAWLWADDADAEPSDGAELAPSAEPAEPGRVAVSQPIHACIDCAMIATNDDDSGAEPGARDRYAAGVAEWRAALGDSARVVIDLSDDDAAPHFRNWGPCDVCGTRLGGDYWDAAIVTTMTLGA